MYFNGYILKKKGESHIPLIFWYLSIFGGLGLLTYAIFRKDPVIIVGQIFGIFIYVRNLILIYNKAKKTTMNKIQNYINGKLQSISTNQLDVHDPSTGEKLSTVVLSNKEDFISCIQSSKKSQLEWAKETPLKRSRILSNYKNLIENNISFLAEIVSKEHGKTLEDAKGSVIRGLEVVEFACGIPHFIKGRIFSKCWHKH